MQKEHNRLYRAIDGFFRLRERGTNIKTEIYAGLLMFIQVAAMAAVAAQMISGQAGIPSFSTVYFGVMVMTVVSTVVMGLVCNAPLIQSVSMGSVVLIVSLMADNLGLALGNVLLIAAAANALYLLVMVIPPARRIVTGAIPPQVKKALPAALGAYLIVYALTQLNLFGIDVNNYSAVLEKMAAAGDALPYWGTTTLSFSAQNAAFAGWYATAAIVTTVVAFVCMTVLHARKFRHATILSFGVSVLVYAVMWVLRGHFMDYYLYAFITPAYGGMYFYDGIQRIAGEFSASVLWKPLAEGLDFTKYINYLKYLESQASGVAMSDVTIDATWKIIGLIGTAFVSFLALNAGETAATIKSATWIAGRDEGELTAHPRLGKAGRIADAYSISALCSAVSCLMGVGPMTVRPESIVGAREGGRTGLAALVAGLLSIVSVFSLAICGLFLDGIIVLGMLLFVAMTLLCSIRDCDTSSPAAMVPFLIMVVSAAVTQSLGAAVLLGIALDVVIRLLDGRHREVKPASIILAAVCGFFLILQFM